jgi:glycosyltransferase involved in cell wall biosynthesis
MSNSNPLVSILMTAYNRELFIREAIESVLKNTYQNFELIIVDDGSKDQTVNIANDYAQKDCRIKVFVNENNIGDYPNRNRAASYAKGKYIMFCDSDDSLIQNGVERCIESMFKFPTAKFGMYWAYYERDPFIRTPSESSKKISLGNPF